MISVPLNTIAPELERLKKKLGITLSQEQERLTHVLNELLLSSDARFWFKRLNFNDPETQNILNSSKDLTKAMEGFKEGFVVLCTIGKLPPQKDTVTSMYFDRAASDLCENLAERAAVILLERFYTASDHELSRRYSPGYGDFSLKMQKELFSFFRSDDIDVKLSDSFYMEPEKSISYIVGVRKK